MHRLSRPNGLTVHGVCRLISELRSLYPEMPGLAFYGCGQHETLPTSY
eukprot:SAG11_NODE_4783_length_1767_cov_1.642686_3_plen_47_part_01